MKTVFRGPTSIRDFLNPINSGDTPLVELPEKLNPYYKDGVRIFMKLMFMLPSGQIKSLAAYNMLNTEHVNGNTANIHTLVEASSGNTSYALSTIGKTFGIENTVAYVSHEISKKKLQTLRLFGIQPEVFVDPLCADPSDSESRIYKANKKGEEPGYLNLDQYSNTSNPEAHELITGPQILRQLENNIAICSAGLGTTGTIVGLSNVFKKNNLKTRIVAGVRSANNMVPGLRTMDLLREIRFDWKKNIDSIYPINSFESYKNSLELIRIGIHAGPSSGLALEALYKEIEHLKTSNLLDTLRDSDGHIQCVCICPDSANLYIDEYFEVLPEELFPQTIHNDTKELLETLQKRNISNTTEVPSISTNEFIIRTKNTEEFTIIDIRESFKYEHSHITGSINIPFTNILSHQDILKKFKESTCILVCDYGAKSKTITRLALDFGIKAYSLEGGFAKLKDMDHLKSGLCTIQHHD